MMFMKLGIHDFAAGQGKAEQEAARSRIRSPAGVRGVMVPGLQTLEGGARPEPCSLWVHGETGYDWQGRTLNRVQ